jgi:hypothetical protein
VPRSRGGAFPALLLLPMVISPAQNQRICVAHFSLEELIFSLKFCFLGWFNFLTGSRRVMVRLSVFFVVAVVVRIKETFP